MRCARSTKEPHLIRYGLWKLHAGLIKLASEFESERNELYAMKLDRMIEEIKRRKELKEDTKMKTYTLTLNDKLVLKTTSYESLYNYLKHMLESGTLYGIDYATLVSLGYSIHINTEGK